jgi:predicted RNase H-like nuclease
VQEGVGVRCVPAPAAGVDGCPGGWIAAVLPTAGSGGTRRAPVLCLVDAGALPDLAARVGVDIPIGLPDGERRRSADTAARSLLAGRRGSSVFPVPVRAVLGSTSYDEASAVSRAVSGRGLSRQTWGIVPKIAEVDAVLTPAVQERVAEVHPEVAFTLLDRAHGAGDPLPSKKTAEGRRRREQLLAGWCAHEGWDVDVARLVAAAPRPARADDALDALACAWSALRWARGQAVELGDPRARDARGLRMTIRA